MKKFFYSLILINSIFFSLKSEAKIDKFANSHEAIKYAIKKSRLDLLKKYLSDINLTDYEKEDFLALATSMLNYRESILKTKHLLSNLKVDIQNNHVLHNLQSPNLSRKKKYSQGASYRDNAAMLATLGSSVFILSDWLLFLCGWQGLGSSTVDADSAKKAFWLNTVITPILLIYGTKRLNELGEKADENFINNHYRSHKQKYLDATQICSILKSINNI